jgi:hypothetical protein
MRFRRETSAHVAFIDGRNPRQALGSARIDDSCPARTVRPTFHRARGLIRHSKRDSHLRSVNTVSAGYSGGPIARQLPHPQALPRGCAAASANRYEAVSPDAQSSICPLSTMSRVSREMGGERRCQARQLVVRLPRMARGVRGQAEAGTDGAGKPKAQSERKGARQLRTCQLKARSRRRAGTVPASSTPTASRSAPSRSGSAGWAARWPRLEGGSNSPACWPTPPVRRRRAARDGRPVVLMPGFLAGDQTLAVIAAWLRRIGYRPRLCAVLARCRLSDRTLDRLERRVEVVWRYYGRRVGLIGHKPWRRLRAALAAHRPESRLARDLDGCGPPGLAGSQRARPVCGSASRGASSTPLHERAEKHASPVIRSATATQGRSRWSRSASRASIQRATAWSTDNVR